VYVGRSRISTISQPVGSTQVTARDDRANCMKTVEAGQFAANVNQYLQESLSEAIILTQAGRPCAVVHGLDYDDEQMQLINSPEFWAMIQQRRERPTIPWEIAKRRLEPVLK